MKRANKYHARKAYRCAEHGALVEVSFEGKPYCRRCNTYTDLLTFDSQAEAKRWDELRLLLRSGHIAKGTLQRQYAFVLNAPSGEQIGKYIADFHYQRIGSGAGLVVEDVKGFDTPLSKWKRKHCELQYGIKIEVIR